MIERGNRKPYPPVVFDINMETYLKIMGVNFHSDPIKWDQQFDTILNKAGKRMYILRVCKKYGGHSLDCLHYLFQRLIMSLLIYAISVELNATK